MPRLRREAEPLKMTSLISPPRRLLALCSPRTQRTASTIFDLPDPFGPTIAVTPAGKSKSTRSAKLLNPTNCNRFSMVPPSRRSCCLPFPCRGLWHGLRPCHNPRQGNGRQHERHDGGTMLKRLQLVGFKSFADRVDF